MGTTMFIQSNIEEAIAREASILYPKHEVNNVLVSSARELSYIWCGLCSKDSHFDGACLAEAAPREAHKGTVVAVGEGNRDWRKPQRYCGPGARWFWNLKTAAVDPQMLLPLVYVSPQHVFHLLNLSIFCNFLGDSCNFALSSFLEAKPTTVLSCLT